MADIDDIDDIDDNNDAMHAVPILTISVMCNDEILH